MNHFQNGRAKAEAAITARMMNGLDNGNVWVAKGKDPKTGADGFLVKMIGSNGKWFATKEEAFAYRRQSLGFA